MIELLFLALALAMDAFAVAIARGAAGEHRLLRAAETGLAFGAAQAVMPLIGWALGTLLMAWIAAVAHWIAFCLLGFLGIRMLMAAFSSGDEGSELAGRGSYYFTLLVAAIATSLDAAVAGLTLELFALPIALACVVIGLVTALLCVPAYWFASRIGSRFGHYAEGAGGVVLIALGCQILVEHLTQ